ncbi:hypothetical protein BT69DRAFT_1282106 [Atractiella rhizophila]|nr:hypothetical protein BT69DRAFT_1282106 [Atractiella rhizophila]
MSATQRSHRRSKAVLEGVLQPKGDLILRLEEDEGRKGVGRELRGAGVVEKENFPIISVQSPDSKLKKRQSVSEVRARSEGKLEGKRHVRHRHQSISVACLVENNRAETTQVDGKEQVDAASFFGARKQRNDPSFSEGREQVIPCLKPNPRRSSRRSIDAEARTHCPIVSNKVEGPLDLLSMLRKPNIYNLRLLTDFIKDPTLSWEEESTTANAANSTVQTGPECECEIGIVPMVFIHPPSGEGEVEEFPVGVEVYHREEAEAEAKRQEAEREEQRRREEAEDDEPIDPFFLPAVVQGDDVKDLPSFRSRKSCCLETLSSNDAEEDRGRKRGSLVGSFKLVQPEKGPSNKSHKSKTRSTKDKTLLIAPSKDSRGRLAKPKPSPSKCAKPSSTSTSSSTSSTHVAYARTPPSTLASLECKVHAATKNFRRPTSKVALANGVKIGLPRALDHTVTTYVRQRKLDVLVEEEEEEEA